MIFWDLFCCTEDLDRKIQIFFFPVGKHHNAVFSIHLSDSFALSCPGVCILFLLSVSWPVLESRWQEELLPAQHSRGMWGCVWSLHCSTLARWGVHPPGSCFPHLWEGNEWQSLVSGCFKMLSGKNIVLVLYYCYHCNHEPRHIMRIKVRSKTALTRGPAKLNCNVFPLSLCTRVCCALWMNLCYHQCRYTNGPCVRLQRICEEVLYLMGYSVCKAST